MAVDDPNPLAALGFLTVLDDDQYGIFGGYLVLSSRGRPLEFHCSTPVLPNQAQRILYGATLRPYLLGEIIGPTLIDKAQLSVHAVLTDVEEMLNLALLRPASVVCVGRSEDAGDSRSENVPVPELTSGNYRLFGTHTCSWQPEQLRQSLSQFCEHVDLLEPFERIREAIREAQRISENQSGDDHEPSAAA